MGDVLHLSALQTASILFILNLTLLLSYLALGWWAPRYIAAPSQPGWPVPQVLKVSLSAMLLCQLAILLYQADAAWLLWLPMAIMYTTMTLVQTHLSLTFPAQLAGRVNTAYNLLMFIGAFITQWGIGIAIDGFKILGLNQSEALRASFAVCLALQIFVFWRFSQNLQLRKN